MVDEVLVMFAGGRATKGEGSWPSVVRTVFEPLHAGFPTAGRHA